MRTYRDHCGVARALDVIGSRWALLVVRELLLGPKRFTDLRTALRGLAPDVLTQRLRELERAGIVRRETLAPPAASQIYQLTERGSALEPVLLELGRWGASEAPPPAAEPLTPDALAIALKTTFRPGPELRLPWAVGLEIEGQRFIAAACSADSPLRLRRGLSDEAPAARLVGDPATLAAVLWHGRQAREAIGAGDLRLEGDEQLARQFLDCFSLPGPAPAAAS